VGLTPEFQRKDVSKTQECCQSKFTIDEGVQGFSFYEKRNRLCQIEAP
jgi:hypothetical protein